MKDKMTVSKLARKFECSVSQIQAFQQASGRLPVSMSEIEEIRKKTVEIERKNSVKAGINLNKSDQFIPIDFGFSPEVKEVKIASKKKREKGSILENIGS